MQGCCPHLHCAVVDELLHSDVGREAKGCHDALCTCIVLGRDHSRDKAGQAYLALDVLGQLVPEYAKERIGKTVAAPA